MRHSSNHTNKKNHEQSYDEEVPPPTAPRRHFHLSTPHDCDHLYPGVAAPIRTAEEQSRINALLGLNA